jgi:hypothetical protein
MVRRSTRAPRAPLAARRPTARPRLELLEGRDLPSFAGPVITPLPSAVTGAAVGDFNGDGRQDLAAGGDGTRVLISRGDGGFRLDQTYATGANSKAVAADVNQDGKLDLVVLGSDPKAGPSLTILLGDGAGRFTARPLPDASGLPLLEPTFLAAGDFNHDGVTDVAVAGEDNSPGPVRRGAVFVLLGGDGTFSGPRRYTVPGVPTGLSTGDVNGDQDLDLIVVTGPTIQVLKGNGDGTFADAVPSPLPTSSAVPPTFADFDADGKTDVAFSAGGAASSFIEVARGTAGGTFAADTRTPITGASAGRLLAADFNRDGKLDLLPLGNDPQLRPGNGDDSFAPPVPVVPGAFPGDGVVGDFDGDGHPDVAGFSASGPISVVLNRPAVSFRVDMNGAAVAGKAYRVTVSARTAAGAADAAYTGMVHFAASDTLAGLPGDYQFTPADHGVRAFDVTLRSAGVQSLTVSDEDRASLTSTAQVTVLAAAALGPVSLAQPRYAAVGIQPRGVALGDFNKDGKPDLAVANAGYLSSGYGGYVTVSLGNGDGTFRPPLRLAAGNNPVSIVAADFNHDGNLDFAAAGNDSLRGVGRGVSVSVYLGNGNGTFRALTPTWLAMPVKTFVPFFELALGDFNGDGWADLALASAGTAVGAGGSVRVLINQHDGNFAMPGLPLPAVAAVAVAAADFNGDGKADVAAGTFLPDPADLSPTFGYKLLVAFGDGNGGLGTPAKYELGGPITSVVTGDFNGDGRTDIAAIRRAVAGRSAAVQVLLNRGDGTFAAPVSYNGGPDPDTLAAADLNGDGRLDLLVVNTASSKVQVLGGAGDGAFAPAGVFFTGAAPHAIAVGDVNNDGRPDVVVPNAGSSVAPETRVGVLLNAGFTQVQLSTVNFVASARAGVAVITVTRTGDLSGATNVNYATSNGTAAAGLDYLSASGVLTFQAGEKTKTFTVQLLPAARTRPGRSVRLALTTADGGATLVAGPALGWLTILA